MNIWIKSARITKSMWLRAACVDGVRHFYFDWVRDKES